MRPELIAILAFAVLLPGVVVALILVHRHQVGARTAAAERLGLAYVRGREGAARGAVLGAIRVRGSDRLVGAWRGRPARVDFARRSHGSHGGTDYTRASLEGGAPPGMSFVLERDSLRWRLGEALGLTKDLKTGDEAFDHGWRVKGNPEAAVLQVLRPPTLRAALAREPSPVAVLAREGRLELLVRRTAMEPERVRAILDLASDLADAVSVP